MAAETESTAERRPRTLQYHATGAGRPLSAGRVIIVGLVAFLVGGLLNADSLYAIASRQPFGWQRTAARQVVAPFRAVSHFTRLNKPRAAIQEAIGRDPEAGTRSKSKVLASSVTTTTVTTTTTAPPGVSTTTVPPRVPTREDPLKLWVGGDSMAQEFGSSVVASAGERGTINAELDYHISTGLTRPDYFDWPLHLRDEVLPKKPEVIMIMFGANDAQAMEIDGAPYKVRTPEWQAEYRKRVALTMDLLSGDDQLVIWVGQPHMRSPEFSERMDIVNGIYASEAQKRPWVRFLDSGPVLAPPGGGGYSAYLPGSNGQPALARTGDGIHLTRFGANRLAAAVMQRLDEELAKGALRR